MYLAEIYCLMSAILFQQGPNEVIYKLFKNLPFFQVLIPLFIFLYLSYVTAADSKTEAIGGLCTKYFYAEATKTILGAKLIWGIDRRGKFCYDQLFRDRWHTYA